VVESGERERRLRHADWFHRQSAAEQDDFCGRESGKTPRNYVAQPIVDLSRSPSFCDGSMQGRHVDLRPYILYGEKGDHHSRWPNESSLAQGLASWSTPRRGGGSKDTWVLEEEEDVESFKPLIRRNQLTIWLF